MQLHDPISHLVAALSGLLNSSPGHVELKAACDRIVPGPPERVPAPPSPPDAQHFRSLIAARQLRARFFGSDLFGEPAWDILLDLAASRIEGRRVSVSSLCIAARVPATTALRWIRLLEERGLLVRSHDPKDGRRTYIQLHPQTWEVMQQYMAAAR